MSTIFPAEIDGRYCPVRVVGKGGMGIVLEAEDRCLDRRVALKILPAHAQVDERARERFLREGRALARIQHPNVVAVYEAGSDGETDYLSMELLEGEDLHARLEREDGPLPLAEVRALGQQLLEALAAMHDAGIVHRDLKPRNLFLCREGSRAGVLKVLDFGVARVDVVDAESLTSTSEVFGTPHYMAPEQFYGSHRATGASDLWSVGAILFEALTGRTPYAAESVAELVLRSAAGNPPPLRTVRRDVPAPIAAAIDRALRREVLERPASARAMLTMFCAPDHQVTPAWSRTRRSAVAASLTLSMMVGPQETVAREPRVLPAPRTVGSTASMGGAPRSLLRFVQPPLYTLASAERVAAQEPISSRESARRRTRRRVVVPPADAVPVAHVATHAPDLNLDLTRDEF